MESAQVSDCICTQEVICALTGHCATDKGWYTFSIFRGSLQSREYSVFGLVDQNSIMLHGFSAH